MTAPQGLKIAARKHALFCRDVQSRADAILEKLKNISTAPPPMPK